MLTKILFACDVHGSEKCWKKFLRLRKRYDVDVMLMSGDLTGKVIDPIIKEGPDSYVCHLFGSEYKLHGEDEVRRIEEKMRDTDEAPKKIFALFLSFLGCNPISLFSII